MGVTEERFKVVEVIVETGVEYVIDNNLVRHDALQLLHKMRACYPNRRFKLDTYRGENDYE